MLGQRLPSDRLQAGQKGLHRWLGVFCWLAAICSQLQVMRLDPKD